MTSPTIDPRLLRQALGTFATGVAIVTTLDAEGSPLGFTANSFTSVSLDPPLVLVCLAKSAASYPVFAAASSFAVNILAESQRETSNSFAARGTDKFSSVTWGRKATGSPVLEDVASWLDCAMHETVEAGDHLILIGRVLDYAYTDEAPLGYCRGAYVSFDLVREALEAADRDGRVRVGAILEWNRALLFAEDAASGALALPSGRRVGTAGEPDSLLGGLAAQGIAARAPFLFAVFEDPQRQQVFYRGSAQAADRPENYHPGGHNPDGHNPDGHNPDGLAGLAFHPLDDLPWARIADPAETAVLRRYVRERETDYFGIYVGNAETGALQHAGSGDEA